MTIPKEVERKFLVTDSGLAAIANARSVVKRIVHGYISVSGAASVRVRLIDGRARLTIKDRSAPPGLERAEFEYEIPTDHAEYLLTQVCLAPPLEKLRYTAVFADREWVVDEFLGDNKGLILAEIELDHRADTFSLPGWVGGEVTDDERYRNSYLFHHPFCEWPRAKAARMGTLVTASRRRLMGLGASLRS